MDLWAIKAIECSWLSKSWKCGTIPKLLEWSAVGSLRRPILTTQAIITSNGLMTPLIGSDSLTKIGSQKCLDTKKMMMIPTQYFLTASVKPIREQEWNHINKNMENILQRNPRKNSLRVLELFSSSSPIRFTHLVQNIKLNTMKNQYKTMIRTIIVVVLDPRSLSNIKIAKRSMVWIIKSK